MDYTNILKFKYTWRNYQARVLANAHEYIKDNKVHIVAAPGSGKTTLGIELIARCKEVALVLAPSITIREQWVARIKEGFLCEGVCAQDYISQDLKNPRAITICTYQALHSAMNRYSGELVDEADDSDKDADDVMTSTKRNSEKVDYSSFDVVQTLKDNRVGLLCLDECHHLRSEWWKALEELKKQMNGFKVIALTATPPYDSTEAMWKRYMDMCGEIDEEIAIPELVKEGSLCPHQDFVYFNYPTEEEREEVDKFRKRSKDRYKQLMESEEFASAVTNHRFVNGLVSDEELLEEPNYLAAMLIFLKEKGVPFPARLQRLLGTKSLPKMSMEWMEYLLQQMLYKDLTSYAHAEEYLAALEKELKTDRIIEKKKVSFTSTPSIEKMLTTSKGKCESIKEIVKAEYAASKENLRLLILTDYIRKEYEKMVGTSEEVNALGVLPFFEQLRRSVASETSLRLGVLCGTIVIIPAEAKDALITEIGEAGNVTFSQIGTLDETDYVKVTAVGDAHFLTAAVTDVFTKGYMQVLIGTKSLLGEGWDAPCINSLILASFVGSFMLSNQMRGRAIRVFKAQPDKTSNIWHLVCLPSKEDVENAEYSNISEDYALLERRMEHFLGLHYTEDVIESGIGRLSVIAPPFDEAHVAQMNQQMLALSGQRSLLKDRWNRSLTIHKKMDVVEETKVKQEAVPKTVFTQKCFEFVVGAIGFVASFVASIVLKDTPLYTILRTASPLFGVYALIQLPKLIRIKDAKNRLMVIGDGIYRALLAQRLIEGQGARVCVDEDSFGSQSVYLSGGTGRDRTLFTKCVEEFFGVIDNQRYILVKSKGSKGNYGFFAVPECLAKRKEDAESFYQRISPYIGKYDLVYTRNESGRKLLLEGRMKTLADETKKTSTNKKLKGF